MAKKISEKDKENKDKTIKNILSMSHDEITDIIKNNVGHFSNKYTNTKSSVYLLKENGFKNSNIKYLSLSSIGLTHDDLFLTSVAKQIPKFNVIKTFLKNDQEQIKELDNSETLIKNFGEDFKPNGTFHKILEKEANKECELDTYCKQLLVFDEDENDYVSLTPLSSLYLNKKMKNGLIEKLEQIKKENPEQDKVKNFWKTVNLSIGGANPQNVGISSDFDSANYFCLLMDTPKLKNNSISYVYTYLLNGIKYCFNKKDLHKLSFLIKNYTTNTNKDNKMLVIRQIQMITNKHVEKCLFIKNKINSLILKQIEQLEIETINFEDPINDLFLEKNKEIKEKIFNSKFKNLEVNTIEMIHLICKFKKYASILANSFIKELILNSKKENMFNYNENIIELLKKEVEKIYAKY